MAAPLSRAKLKYGARRLSPQPVVCENLRLTSGRGFASLVYAVKYLVRYQNPYRCTRRHRRRCGFAF